MNGGVCRIELNHWKSPGRLSFSCDRRRQRLRRESSAPLRLPRDNSPPPNQQLLRANTPTNPSGLPIHYRHARHAGGCHLLGDCPAGLVSVSKDL
jgi:hypothetical protein